MGNAKAAVLPVPVWAMPQRSRPPRTFGMAWDWIGVGVVYPSAARARRIGLARPNSEKLSKTGASSGSWSRKSAYEPSHAPGGSGDDPRDEGCRIKAEDKDRT